MALLALYLFTMMLLNGWEAAVEQFDALWYLMVPLAAGFGIQVGLYTKLKQTVRNKANGALAAGGTTASAAMLACCAHHVTDVLPFIGVSGATLFLTRYQAPILFVSIGINAMGIVWMLKHLRTLRT